MLAYVPSTERLPQLTHAGEHPHSIRVSLRYPDNRPPILVLQTFERRAAGNWVEIGHNVFWNVELAPVISALATGLDRMREHERRRRLRPTDAERYVSKRVRRDRRRECADHPSNGGVKDGGRLHDLRWRS